MKKTYLILLLVCMLAIAGCNSSKLDIGGSDCQANYKAVPGPVYCTSDSECNSKLAPNGLDSDTSLRCSAGNCEFKISGSCGGEVR